MVDAPIIFRMTMPTRKRTHIFWTANLVATILYGIRIQNVCEKSEKVLTKHHFRIMVTFVFQRKTTLIEIQCKSNVDFYCFLSLISNDLFFKLTVLVLKTHI